LSFTLAPGPQTLVLSREGYETESVPLEVTPGQSIDRALTLRPTAPPPVATAVAAPTPSVAPAAPAAPAAARPKRAATPAPSASAPARPKIRVLDDNDPP
jgi:hypothetical protein